MTLLFITLRMVRRPPFGFRRRLTTRRRLGLLAVMAVRMVGRLPGRERFATARGPGLRRLRFAAIIFRVAAFWAGVRRLRAILRLPRFLGLINNNWAIDSPIDYASVCKRIFTVENIQIFPVEARG